MKPSVHLHPKPLVNRLSQSIALLGVALLVISAPLQIVLGFAGGGLFILSAFFSLLLTIPLLMATVIAPAVRVDESGITLMPLFWKNQPVAWDAIAAVKPYPLLPPSDAEVTRKLAIGKVKYQPADGIMLVIPKLPMLYRIGGFFAGERSQPIIAITNRAHSDYVGLVYAILHHTDVQIHDEELKVVQ